MTKQSQCPSGVQCQPLRTRPKAEFDGTGGRVGRVGRVGRSRKVSFKFLHTLWINRLCIFLLVYEIKLSPTFLWVSKFDVKLKVGEHNFQKYPIYVSFFILWFQKSTDISCISHFFENLKNVFSNAYLKKFGSKRVNFLFVFI